MYYICLYNIYNYEIYQNRAEVTHLYFYGAGCGIQSTVDRILKVFKEIFTDCEFIDKFGKFTV